jgi:hypothetical protein
LATLLHVAVARSNKIVVLVMATVVSLVVKVVVVALHATMGVVVTPATPKIPTVIIVVIYVENWGTLLFVIGRGLTRTSLGSRRWQTQPLPHIILTLRGMPIVQPQIISWVIWTS